MRKKLFLILLPFAWMAKVEAQTATINGFFNPLGWYEDNGIAADGWSSYSAILGWYNNPDGTIQVFTNFDTLVNQHIDYSFVIDGENWYPSSEKEGTYGVFYFNDQRYIFGEYGVVDELNQTVVSIEESLYGSRISHAWVDTERNQVLLIKRVSDDPIYEYDLPQSTVITWDGTLTEVIASGMTNVTSILEIPDEPNSLLITADQLDDEPGLFKLDLEQRMLVDLPENQAFPNEIGPVGTLTIADGTYFMDKPAIVGHAPGWGSFVSLLTENGWDEIYTPDFASENRISVSDDGTTLYCLSGSENLDDIGYVSGIGFTTDMETWQPVIDKRDAKCSSGSRAIMLWSKGVMWVLGERAHTFSIMNDDYGEDSYDIYVLKDTYTAYVSTSEESARTFSVYPNPATESFQYGLPFEATLVSIEGKIVKTINENESYVDVRDVPSGIYLLTLADGSNSSVVINH